MGPVMFITGNAQAFVPLPHGAIASMGPVMFITGNMVGSGRCPRIGSCFNGAGDVHHRKHRCSVGEAKRVVLLQWGR